MTFDASVFLYQIESITAAIHKLNKGTELLFRKSDVLRRQIPDDCTDAHKSLDAMDSIISYTAVVHYMLLERVEKILPAPGNLELKPNDDPHDALCECTIVLTIIRNAMDMLANDHREITSMVPWQQELFTKAHARIAEVIQKLNAVQQALRNEMNPEEFE